MRKHKAYMQILISASPSSEIEHYQKSWGTHVPSEIFALIMNFVISLGFICAFITFYH